MPATNFLMALTPNRILSRNQLFVAPFINYQTGRYIGDISIAAGRFLTRDRAVIGVSDCQRGVKNRSLSHRVPEMPV